MSNNNQPSLFDLIFQEDSKILMDCRQLFDIDTLRDFVGSLAAADSTAALRTLIGADRDFSLWFAGLDHDQKLHAIAVLPALADQLLFATHQPRRPDDHRLLTHHLRSAAKELRRGTRPTPHKIPSDVNLKMMNLNSSSDEDMNSSATSAPSFSVPSDIQNPPQLGSATSSSSTVPSELNSRQNLNLKDSDDEDMKDPSQFSSASSSSSSDKDVRRKRRKTM